MTDNSDLMGAGAPPASPAQTTPKPRGRPKKVTPPAVPKPTTIAEVTAAGADTAPQAGLISSLVVGDSTGAETEHVPEVFATSVPGLIATDTDVTQALVDKATGAILEPPDPNVAAELERLDKEAADRKAVEALMGDVPTAPAPVSTAFAAAQAQRITIVGQGKREYAYQRVLRAGKKL